MTQLKNGMTLKRQATSNEVPQIVNQSPHLASEWYTSVMKKISTPHPPNEKDNILTEGINYFSTGTKSIWGDEDKVTKEVIKKYVKPGSSWLNLAAGDGRYNTLLVKIANNVTAVDVDKGALSKLWFTTPKKYQPKVKIKILDITKTLPFSDKSFDGVFTAGTLHLFPIDVLESIKKEFKRIIKKNGYFISEFAVDIKRVSPNGKLVKFEYEPLFSMKSAKKILRKLTDGFTIKFIDGPEIYENCKEANPPYKFYCNTLLMVGKKL